MDKIEYEIRSRGMLGLRLGAVDVGDTQRATQDIPGLTYTQLADLRHILACRSNRGRGSLEDAIKLFCMPTDYRSQT